MRKILLIASLAFVVPLAAPVAAQAPTWSAEQQAVWAVIDQSWQDEVARNGKWPSSYVDPNVAVWGPEFPMPRYKDSMERWTRYYNKAAKTVQYEIQPMSISISGNTAVVNYGAVTMSQREVAKGENPPAPHREMVGISETLVRSGNGWKYLSSVGFPLGDQD